jgi:hypothetical protein
MRQCLKDTGFRWPQKPPNASEVKFNRGYNKYLKLDGQITVSIDMDKFMMTANGMGSKDILPIPI